MVALSLKDVKFKYEGSEGLALNGLSLEVRKGEFVSLLGGNGSGKSTMCLLANGLIPHAVRGTLEGTVEVFGLDVRQHSVAELSTRVGIVFQEPESQLFCMSVEEEVAFGPENLGVPREEIAERVEWALGLVGLSGMNERSPHNLSGGEKQRVAIAAALSMRPELLVLDEPAYALDPVGRIELFRVLQELKDRHGMTVLLADRDSEEAALYSDRVVLLSRGQVIAEGPPRRVLRDPRMLESMGVTPPQMAEVASLLNARIPDDGFDFLSVDEAERAIVARLFPKRRMR
ncbi:MAG: ATP-binding cassette domain-containing protein [Thermoplasmata archaeon]